MLLPCDSSSSDGSAGSTGEWEDESEAEAGARPPLTDFLHVPCSSLGESFVGGDEVSCAAARGGALVLGTRRGLVLAWRPAGGPPLGVRSHGREVLCVALDDSGTSVGSSSLDGSVAVGPLARGVEGPDWVCAYPCAVLGLALCPSYASGGLESRSLCAGGEERKLILTRQGLFAPKHITIHSGEGPISNVQWRGTLIAWSNAKGVKVVDVETYQKVTHIPKPSLSAPDDECAFRGCCLTWSADDVLLVGWGSCVMVAVVRQKHGGPAGVRFATVTHSFCVAAGTICGLAAFDSKHLSLLTLAQNSHDVSSRTCTAHHICTWAGQILCSESLPTDGNRPISLATLPGGTGLQYIVTTKDLIATRRRTVSDLITWLIDRSYYEVAIALMRSSGGLGPLEYQRILSSCVAPLLACNSPLRAVGIIQQLQISESETWKECTRLFEAAGKLHLLVPEVPVPPVGMKLPQELYDFVLRCLASTSPFTLRATLDRWPHDVFSVPPLMELLRRALPGGVAGPCESTESADAEAGVLGESPPRGSRASEAEVSGSGPLVEALALLQEAEGDLVGASRLLARARSGLLLPFLGRHLPGDEALNAGAAADFGRLFELGRREALALAVAQPSVFRPSSVLEAVAPSGRWWEHRYLRLLLRESRAATGFHELHATLSAELEPHAASSWIRPPAAASEGSETTAFHDGHSACFRAHGALDAEVWLLEQQGRFEEAMMRLLHGAGDVLGAMRLIDLAPREFAQDLWSRLLPAVAGDSRAYSLVMCLNASGAQPPVPCATPAQLLHRLPAGLEIPQLSLKITRALDDAESDRDLHLLALGHLKTATASLSAKTFKQQRLGMAVVNAKEESKAASATSQESARRPWRIPWRRAALSLL